MAMAEIASHKASAWTWWNGKRPLYNAILVGSALLSFIAFTAIMELWPSRLPPETEITLFTLVFQAVGFLVALGIANLCYCLGPIAERILHPARPERFRLWAFTAGSLFSAVPILTPPLVLGAVALFH